MTTDLDDPVIIATLTTADGEPDGPLLTGGCHRLCKAAVTGAGLPAFLLTAAETLSIRHPVIPRIRPGGGCRDGDPVMITVTIWHNVARDHEGRHTGCWTATSPATPWSASSPTRQRLAAGPRRSAPTTLTRRSTPTPRCWRAASVR